MCLMGQSRTVSFASRLLSHRSSSRYHMSRPHGRPSVSLEMHVGQESVARRQNVPSGSNTVLHSRTRQGKPIIAAAGGSLRGGNNSNPNDLCALWLRLVFSGRRRGYAVISLTSLCNSVAVAHDSVQLRLGTSSFGQKQACGRSRW